MVVPLVLFGGTQQRMMKCLMQVSLEQVRYPWISLFCSWWGWTSCSGNGNLFTTIWKPLLGISNLDPWNGDDGCWDWFTCCIKVRLIGGLFAGDSPDGVVLVGSDVQCWSGTCSSVSSIPVSDSSDCGSDLIGGCWSGSSRSVTQAAANSYSWKMSRFKGYIPVFRKPLAAFSAVAHFK